MRQIIGALLISVIPVSASLANNGCDAAVTQRLTEAATRGAELEIQTKSVEEIPKARDVSCWEQIAQRDVGIWVDFPSLSDIGSEISKRGCQAIEAAMDDVLDAGSITIGIPGTDVSGGTFNGSAPYGSNTTSNKPVSSDLLDALDSLRNGGFQ